MCHTSGSPWSDTEGYSLVRCNAIQPGSSLQILGIKSVTSILSAEDRRKSFLWNLGKYLPEGRRHIFTEILPCGGLSSSFFSFIYCALKLTREWSDPTCRNLPWFFFTTRVHTTKYTVKILAANTHCKYFFKIAEHGQYCSLPDPWRNVHP
jgi:hypothetical protein